MQGHTFSYDVRILPLKCYDLILGVEWLEDHSPTWIHWKKRIMKFPHNGQQIQLQGLLPNIDSCTSIFAKKLKGLIRRQGLLQSVQVVTVSSNGHISSKTTLLPFDDAPNAAKEVLQQFT